MTDEAPWTPPEFPPISPLVGQLYTEVDGVPINLNQSRVQTFLRCKRKYGWFHVEQLTPDRPTVHFEVGTAVHKVLAEVAGGKLLVENVGPAVVKYFQEAFKKTPRFPGDTEIIEEQSEMLHNLMPAYYDHYKNEAQPWTPIGLEVSGRVEVGTGTNVFLVFRTDQLAIDMRMLWIVDHKTMKKLDARDFLKYEMDLQVSAYTYAITKHLKKRVAGFIINALIKTKVPQFHRERFTRDEDELAEFEREFVEIARDIKSRHMRVANGEDWKTVFYKNPQECFSYGTCWFRDLCVKDTEIRRMAFKAREPDYVDDPRKLIPVKEVS